jgi:hypothetical protein
MNIPTYICRSKNQKAAAPDCNQGECTRVRNCVNGALLVNWLKVAKDGLLQLWFDKQNGLIYFDERRPQGANMVKATVPNLDYDPTAPVDWNNYPTKMEWRHIDRLEGMIIQLLTKAELPMTGNPEKLYYCSEDKRLRIWDQFTGGYTEFERTTN